MTKDEALKLALKNLLVATKHLDVCPGTVQAAEEALAQPEPFNPDWASYRQGKEDGQREWVGLTPADFEKLEQLYGHQVSNDFAFANIVCQVESLLREKNHVGA